MALVPPPWGDMALSPPPCDGCRYCPSEYPQKGVTGATAVEEAPDSDYAWRTTCARGHDVQVTWVWDGPLSNRVPTYYAYRSPLWTECTDREVPCIGARLSRYERKWVI